ncbi:MAG TPA: response regulator [Ramlibacter sp.]|nr:response regulator [Ramlibacter sp.]
MKPRVLLIEDNPASMELGRYLLEAHGFECIAAFDGLTGLRQAAASRPDLVLCDLQLPDVDGFEVLRRLRGDATLAAVPVVAITAFAMVGDRDRVLAAGFDGYLAKPVDPQRFAAQVRGFLRAGRAGGER